LLQAGQIADCCSEFLTGVACAMVLRDGRASARLHGLETSSFPLGYWESWDQFVTWEALQN
jgi:hypothetical protein